MSIYYYIGYGEKMDESFLCTPSSLTAGEGALDFFPDLSREIQREAFINFKGLALVLWFT